MIGGETWIQTQTSGLRAQALNTALGAPRQARCQVQNGRCCPRCFSVGSSLGLAHYEKEQLDSGVDTETVL